MPRGHVTGPSAREVAEGPPPNGATSSTLHKHRESLRPDRQLRAQLPSATHHPASLTNSAVSSTTAAEQPGTQLIAPSSTQRDPARTINEPFGLPGHDCDFDPATYFADIDTEPWKAASGKGSGPLVAARAARTFTRAPGPLSDSTATCLSTFCAHPLSRSQAAHSSLPWPSSAHHRRTGTATSRPVCQTAGPRPKVFCGVKPESYFGQPERPSLPKAGPEFQPSQ